MTTTTTMAAPHLSRDSEARRTIRGVIRGNGRVSDIFLGDSLRSAVATAERWLADARGPVEVEAWAHQPYTADGRIPMFRTVRA